MHRRRCSARPGRNDNDINNSSEVTHYHSSSNDGKTCHDGENNNDDADDDNEIVDVGFEFESNWRNRFDNNRD